MNRAALCVLGVLMCGPALAQPLDLVGRWRNTLGREVEFKQDGTIDIAGIGTGKYRACSEEGADLCVDYEQFECEFRATYDSDTKTLLLVTGRPTKNCPDGRFARLGTAG